MTYRIDLAALALGAAIALTAVACDGGDGRTKRDAAPGTTTPTGSPEGSRATQFMDVRASLVDMPVRDLFEVEADDAEYWRMFTLDRYDGETWTSTNMGGSERGVPQSAPAILSRSGDIPPAGTELLNQTFRILGDFDTVHALPMAQTAEKIAGPVGDITWDPARSQAFIDGDLQAGMEYTVRSRIVVPTPEELDRVDHLAPRMYGQWTELPADLDPRIRRIAERWTADATSNYRTVLAIQQRFQNGRFVYSTDVEPADDLLEFLTETRAGFCQQYSSAMAVMVRTVGLPARVAVGYRSGTQQDDGNYLVRTTDAHVWVEVLFPGYGWLQFEPEAGAAHPNAQAGTYLNPVVPANGS